MLDGVYPFDRGHWQLAARCERHLPDHLYQPVTRLAARTISDGHGYLPKMARTEERARVVMAGSVLPDASRITSRHPASL